MGSLEDFAFRQFVAALSGIRVRESGFDIQEEGPAVMALFELVGKLDLYCSERPEELGDLTRHFAYPHRPREARMG